MRFPLCFVAADEARELQRKIEKEIAIYIGKRYHSAAATKRFGRAYSPHQQHGRTRNKGSRGGSSKTTGRHPSHKMS